MEIYAMIGSLIGMLPEILGTRVSGLRDEPALI